MNPLTETARPTLTELARHRHGVVTREELLDREVSSSTIARWLKQGRIAQLHQGIYLIAGAPEDFMVRALAAQCYVDRQARRKVDRHEPPHLCALSGTTAAWLHDFPWVPEPQSPFVLSNRPSRTRRVLVVHLPTLSDRDVVEMHSTTVTTPAVTLVRAADLLRDKHLEDLLVQLPRRGVLTRAEVVEAIQRHGTYGAEVLLAKLVAMSPELFRTRSGSERIVVRGLHDRGVHAFEVNAVRQLSRRSIEFDILAGKHAEEIDGPHHLLPSQQRWDEERDEIARRHGITVVRTTTAELHADPEATIDAMAARIRAARNT